MGPIVLETGDLTASALDQRPDDNGQVHTFGGIFHKIIVNGKSAGEFSHLGGVDGTDVQLDDVAKQFLSQSYRTIVERP